MQKTIFILMALVSSLSFADGMNETSTTVSRFRYYGGLGLSNYSYKEDVAPPKKSTETGTLTTVSIGLLILPRTEEKMYGRFEARLSPSNTMYDGTTQAGKPLPPSMSENSHFLDLEANIIFNYTSALDLYVGYGLHGWNRGAPNLPSVVSYSEYYHWTYLPLGAIYNLSPSSKIKIQIDGSLRPTLFGGMTADFTKAGGPKLDFDLGPTVGVKLQVPIIWMMSETSSLSLTPWYELSSIGESNTVSLSDGMDIYGFREPSSTTVQYGSNLLLTLAI